VDIRPDFAFFCLSQFPVPAEKKTSKPRPSKGQLRAAISAAFQQMLDSLREAESDFRPVVVDDEHHARKDSTKRGAIWVLLRYIQPAILHWLPGYRLRFLPRDIVAGITVGLMIVPQGLAYAQLAGLPRQYGIYTGFPAILYVILGTSRQAAIGPMSIPALLIGSSLQSLSLSPEAQVNAVMAITFYAGLISFLFGFLHMGFITRFISKPVLTGFISGSAILTIASAVPALLGIQVQKSQVIYQYIYRIAAALPSINLATALTSLLAIFFLKLYSTMKIARYVPSPLVGLVLSILVFWIWQEADGASPEVSPGVYRNPVGVSLVGKVPQDFPNVSFPNLSVDYTAQLLATSVSVFLVAYLEHVAVTKTYAVKHGYDVYPTSELVALGVSNAIGSIFQSFLVMGSFGRSAINDNLGARSQITGLVSVATCLIVLLLIMPAFVYLPNAVLSAIIVLAVIKLVDVRGASHLWKLDKKDFVIMLVAFLATLFLGILLGIIIAIALSILLYIFVTAQPRIDEWGREVHSVSYAKLQSVGVIPVQGVKILAFMAPLFFANSSILKDNLLRELVKRRRLPPRLQWRYMVLAMGAVTSIDTTSIQTVIDLIIDYHKDGVPLLLAGVNDGVLKALRRAGAIDNLGGDRFVFRRVHDCVRAAAARQLTMLDVQDFREHVKRKEARAFVSKKMRKLQPWIGLPSVRIVRPVCLGKVLPIALLHRGAKPKGAQPIHVHEFDDKAEIVSVI
jgi:SulP family sulfate permease